MIVITGATGQLGSQIVSTLLEKVPADQVAVSVRDPQKASDLSDRGVRVRAGDFSKPEELGHAFEGASQVLVVSAATTGGSAVDQHAAVIDAAKAAGATRVIYTSHQAAAADSLFSPMPDHFATEKYLATTGIAWTALRNGFYANFVPRLLGGALQTGELVAPADGPVSWTTHADLGEAAAAVLADDGHFEGVTPPLTGPESLDLEAIAAIVSDITGKTITRVVADDDEYVAAMVGRGAPQAQADMLLGMFLASRRGEFDNATTDFADLVGHPATRLRTFLEGALAQ